MGGDPNSGGDPDDLARCTDCGHVYPVQRLDDGTLRPIGIEGVCRCGNDEFRRLRRE
ncbi:hypothetical protein [Halorarum salinum]|uniref:Uncharacterized protein n=1 Tax=Halorarum salinum TaxID=2743089 RepID=A0A7D5LA44_9EURY|nr:hypothetical protein [Halobaculum salinum]QLG61329.1 hypothetical protein HUG12_06100 [Halobaculum salinum]